MRDDSSKQTLQMIKTVAPGTVLREGLENILRAKTGGLIVVGVNSELMKMVNGGFSIDCKCTPSHLYELAKMDGAIILNDDATTILYANTQLSPESSTDSGETGIRHRTAQRIASDTGKLVISVSQRRNIITLYKGTLFFELQDIGVILTKAAHAISTLERYKNVLYDQYIELGALEFNGTVTLAEIVPVIQTIDIVLRIRNEIEKYVVQLGTEGSLVQMQLDDLMKNVEDEARRLLRDYQRTSSSELELKDIFSQHKKTGEKATPGEVIDPARILKVLGYSSQSASTEEYLVPRGYRMIWRVNSKLRVSTMNKIVDTFGRLPDLMAATIEELDAVEGVGSSTALQLKNGLRRLHDQHIHER